MQVRWTLAWVALGQRWGDVVVGPGERSVAATFGVVEAEAERRAEAEAERRAEA